MSAKINGRFAAAFCSRTLVRRSKSLPVSGRLRNWKNIWWTGRFQNAATLYEQLRKVSPKYADTVAGGEAAAMLDQYLYDTRRSGQSHQEAARVLTQPKREVEEARSVINDTWKSGIKDYLEIDGKPRDPRELHRIRQEAERIASRGGVSGEAAIRAAVGQIDAQRTTVNAAFETFQTAVLAEQVTYGIKTREKTSLNERLYEIARTLAAQMRTRAEVIGASLLAESGVSITDETGLPLLLES